MRNEDHHIKMAANKKKSVVLTQKAINSRTASTEQKRKCSPIFQMSPEAREAMGMAREDTKENLRSSPSNTKAYVDTSGNDAVNHRVGASYVDNNNNDDTTFQSSNSRHSDTGRQRIHSSSNRLQRLPPRHTKVTISKGAANNTARSRSTLSNADPPFSTSDNTESCNHTTTASSASVYTTNNSTSVSGNMNHLGKPVANPIEDDDYDDADEETDEIGTLQFEQDISNGNALPTREKSFVLALDRALERNSISRLKGDITDLTRIHEPGTVRALDGGRLANAQEVVVNVCHNDDKQLVFHDDDEESLDTAKEISQIRVNIWMEYNSEFPPDNDIHDFQMPDIPDESSSQKRPPSGTVARSSGEKNSAESQKRLSNVDVKSKSIGDRNRTNYRTNVNDKTNRNSNAPTARPKTSGIPPKSGSSGSSRGPSQTRSSSKKRIPVNSQTRK